jgi:photosynthetic reaction center cytochrome c subunit
MRLDRIVLSTLCLTLSLVSASPLYAQDPPVGVAAQARAQRPPENLKVLPPIPNLRAEMQKIADSLGVECSFCHVQGNFPSDERREKLTARRMMEMVKNINATTFASRKPQEGDSPLGGPVTCYTCHRGAERPVSALPAAAKPGD